MTPTEGLLIVLVIILTILIFTRPMHSDRNNTKSHEWDCVNKKTGELTNVKMGYSSPESAAVAEHQEYFSACKDAPDMKSICSDGDGTFSYAENEYGSAGMDFKSWITSQSVDGQVLKNHSEFVKDRVGKDGVTFTGKTYALPDWEEADQGSGWIGIRGRPARVQVCNPTQVTEANSDWFPEKQRLTW